MAPPASPPPRQPPTEPGPPPAPGLRAARTTALFRALNPELFVAPNWPVMGFGLAALSLGVAYLAYLHASTDARRQDQHQDQRQGEGRARPSASKWD